MPDLSPEERGRRQRAVDFARTSTELSGGSLTPEFDALNLRYISGELSDSEHIDALLAYARSVPAGEPVQEYFTTAAEAMKAHTAGYANGERSWQLALVGELSEPVSAELVADLTRLLDLRPDLGYVAVQTDAGGFIASRDWPSWKVDDVDALERRIATAPSIRGVTLHPRQLAPIAAGTG